MFGLMRAKSCGMSAGEKHFRRLHYCGTCKTIGSLYGQRSRLLLNHDIVFLAEILTSLNEEKITDWQKPYQSYNCLSLPNGEMPFSLRFAAAANVILTEFKIADHALDTRQRRFRLAHRIFSKQFIEAQEQFSRWDFPLENVREILDEQADLEKTSTDLDELADPTARTTAVFFSEGVRLIGKNELENTAADIGYGFGKLTYILDAYLDFEQDAKRGEFNALRADYGDVSKQKAVSILHQLESEVISNINRLPIADDRKRIFAARLRSNLQKKLGTHLPVRTCSPKRRQSISERYSRAKSRAKELTADLSWGLVWPVFAFVLVFAFVAPAYAREARSPRECAELGFNLIFLGSLIGGVLALPKNLMQGGGGYTPPTAEELEQLKKKEPAAGDSDLGDMAEEAVDGCCCCCCDCDGCCGGCDCCDSCDCCDCSCD